MNIKEWFKPTGNKVLFLIITVSIIIGGYFGITNLIESMRKPEIVFKNPITLEYGQHTDADQISSGESPFEILRIESIIDEAQSSYDKISLYEDGLSEVEYREESMKLDTTQVGEHSGVLYASLGKNIESFPFEYLVEDTEKPKLENVKDLKVDQDEALIHEFIATDPIDGELQVEIEGSYDTTIPGEYTLAATATDQNNNKTSEEFTLTVIEKKVEVQKPSSVITNGGTGRKVVALTFDDGPHPTNTPRLLNILDEKGVKATFFILGERADEYPNIVKQTHAKGHEVENHSYSHPDLSGASLAVLDKEVERTNKIIENLTGRRPVYLRPPYGSYNKQVSSNISNQIALWSVDTLDWKSRNAVAVQESALSQVRNGSVILMHDIHSTTVDAVGPLIDSLKAQGYTFVRLDELQ